MSRATPADSSKVIEMPDGARLVGPTTFSIRAYHGTPHKVDKFRLDKIGTGEGAQAYGWGLYFAESKGVADQYRKVLVQKQKIGKSAPLTAKEDVQRIFLSVGNIEEVKNIVRAEIVAASSNLIEAQRNPDTSDFTEAEANRDLKRWQAALSYINDNYDDLRGNLYTVELLPDADEFLDWDKPLSEQGEKVKAAFAQLYKDNKSAFDYYDKTQSSKFSDGSIYGSALYARISMRDMPAGNDAQASKILASMGVKGIKYLDGGSRGDGKGTYNYVIFDENLVRILEENGKPVGETFSLRKFPVPPGLAEAAQKARGESSLILAYQAAQRGSSSVMVPIRAVYDAAKKHSPALTPAAFMAQINALNEAGSVLIGLSETTKAVEDAGAFRVGAAGTEMAFAPQETFSLAEPSPGGLSEAERRRMLVLQQAITAASGQEFTLKSKTVFRGKVRVFAGKSASEAKNWIKANRAEDSPEVAAMRRELSLLNARASAYAASRPRNAREETQSSEPTVVDEVDEMTDEQRRSQDRGQAYDLLLQMRGESMPLNSEKYQAATLGSFDASAKSDSLYLRFYLTPTPEYFKQVQQWSENELWESGMPRDLGDVEAGYTPEDATIPFTVRISDHPTPASSRTETDYDVAVDDGGAWSRGNNWYKGNGEARTFAGAVQNLFSLPGIRKQLGLKQQTPTVASEGSVPVGTPALRQGADQNLPDNQSSSSEVNPESSRAAGGTFSLVTPTQDAEYMAAVESGGLSEAGLNPKEIIDRIETAVENLREFSEDEGLPLGIRWLQTDYPGAPTDFRVGEMMPESYEWNDGESTGISLGGTAVFDTNKPERVVKYANGFQLAKRYSDLNFAIVIGEDVGSGGMPEPGARVFRNARILQILRFPKDPESSRAAGGTFSLVTPTQDAEYMAAVESGDVAKQQAMVDAAAKAAGYDVRPMYHGTNRRFTEFDAGKIGKNERRENPLTQGKGMYGDGFYFTRFKGDAANYGSRVLKVFLRLANPMVLSRDDVLESREARQSWESKISDEYKSYLQGSGRSPDDAWQTITESWANAKGPMGVEYARRSMARDARKYGFDSIQADLREGKFGETIVFDPNQIKSADPITRDESGQIIPLSQRFNPERNEITFSLRSGDFASRMAAAFSPFQRNPELRMAIARVAKERAMRLGAEWIEKAAVIRSASSINREVAFREADGFDRRMTAYLDSLTPNARQNLEFEPASLEDDPLISAMLDFGKLMSRSTAIKNGVQNMDEFEGAPWLPPAWYSKGSGITPGKMAKAMHEGADGNGGPLAAGDSAADLWDAVASRIESSRKDKAAYREAVQAFRDAKKTARAEAKAEAEAWGERTKKTAGSPKAQRDMLKAALRTLDGILSAAPPEVRARVGGYVKLAGLATDEAMLQEIERRVAKLNVELEKWLKKEGVAEIQKLLKRGRPDAKSGKRGKGKDADMHALFAAAERAIPMTAEAVAGELARLDALIGGDALTPEQEALAITERGIVELAGDLKSADSGRVFSALDSLREIYEGGWLKWKLAQIEKREERAGMRGDFIADTGKSGVKPERDAADKAAVTLLGKIKGGFLSLSSFHEVLAYAFGSKSDRVKALVDAEREASGQYEDVTQSLADEVESLFSELAGGSVLAGERLRFDMSQRTIQTGKGDLSQLEAIQALLMWRQEDGRRHMEGAMDENGKPIGPWNYDQAWIDEITAALTPEARSVMAWLSQKYAAEHPALNALYRERYGVNMPAHDNYAPITVQPVQTKSGEVNDPVSGAAISSGSVLVPGSLRARSRSAIAEPDFRDSLQTFMAHTRQLEYWKAYYDLAFEASAILGNREVLNAVKAKGGEPAATALRKWIDAIAQGGFRDASATLGLHKLLSRMTGRAASVGLLGRFSTLLVQSTQLGAASVKMPVGAYLVRLSKLLTGNLSFRDAVNSPFIQRRYKSAPPIVRQALEGLGVAFRPNQITRATRHLGNLLSGADAMFTAGTYAMLLDYHRGTGQALGLSGAELETHAHTEAERDTEAVAQPTRMATRSLAELTSTNPLAKVSWAYASEARQKIALMAWATMKATAEPAQFAKTAFLVFGVGGLMTQILKNLWREAKGDDDEKKWSPERLALSAMAGPLHGVPLASELMGNQGMLSGVAWAWPALKDIASGEGDMRDVDTLLSAAGLFNDTAAGVASLSHVGLDAAKLLTNLASEK
jgi:hypothetical protein